MMIATTALWLLALLATGLGARTWRGTRRALVSASTLVLVPVPIVRMLPAAWADWLCGTEGAVEALTEGLLLGLTLRAVRLQQPWLALGAGILLLEEVDYGQKFLPIATPDFLLALPSRSDALNFHNLPGSGLWRMLPLAALLVLARSPGALTARLRLPVFAPGLRPALLTMLLLGVPTTLLSSPRMFNESFELAAVALVVLAWKPAR